MKISWKHKFFVVLILLFFLFPGNFGIIQSQEYDSISLPQSKFLSISIDELIQKRTSIRDFSNTPLSMKDLSTILWNAYGIREDGSRTIPSVKGEYAVTIYVLIEEGVYWYEPSNHSLIFYKSGDFRSIGQYDAPVQLGLCWDITRNNDENIVGLQLGAVGQNIYHTCTALDLGTVATANIPSPLDSIGLPEHHHGKIIMPIGHPIMETKYLWLPLWISFLPKVTDTNIAFSSTVQNWTMNTSFSHDMISKQKISQFLWACYGYSYYLDHSGFKNHPIERHRTVPSAHAYYPLEIITLSSDGVSHYIPGLRHSDPIGLPIVTFQWKLSSNDLREEIAQITEQSIQNALFSLVICLNIKDTIQWDDLSDPSLRWVWTYEIGSCIQNLLLETYSRDFSMKLITIGDSSEVNSILDLDSDYESYIIVSIG